MKTKYQETFFKKKKKKDSLRELDSQNVGIVLVLTKAFCVVPGWVAYTDGI